MIDSFRIYPWPDLEAFEQVYSVIHTLKLDSKYIDEKSLAELVWTRDQLVVWKSKQIMHHYHELNATCSILTAKINEYQYIRAVKKPLNQFVPATSTLKEEQIDEETSDSELDLQKWLTSFTQQELSSVHATALLEFFKMLAYYEINHNGKVTKVTNRSDANVAKIVERLQLPPYIIEYRHRIAHSQVPSLRQLQIVLQIALDWLRDNYWNRLRRTQKENHVPIQQSLTKLKPLVQRICNLFANQEETIRRVKRKRGENIDARNLVPRLKVMSESELAKTCEKMQKLLQESGIFAIHSIALQIVNETVNEFTNITPQALDQSLKREYEELQKKLKLITKLQSERNPSLQSLEYTSKLISPSTFSRFVPLFKVLIKIETLHTIPMLLSCLHDICVEHEDATIRKTAFIWFAQLHWVIVYSLAIRDLLKAEDRIKINRQQSKNILFSTYTIFRLSDEQRYSIKWLHLFFRLVHRLPERANLCVYIAQNFYPLVKCHMNEEKFARVNQLLSIYLNPQNSENASKDIKYLSDIADEPQFKHEQFCDEDWYNVEFGSN